MNRKHTNTKKEDLDQLRNFFFVEQFSSLFVTLDLHFLGDTTINIVLLYQFFICLLIVRHPLKVVRSRVTSIINFL